MPYVHPNESIATVLRLVRALTNLVHVWDEISMDFIDSMIKVYTILIVSIAS